MNRVTKSLARCVDHSVVSFRVAIVLLLLVGGAFFYVRYYFVFGSGVKAGTLNYVVKKG